MCRFDLLGGMGDRVDGWMGWVDGVLLEPCWATSSCGGEVRCYRASEQRDSSVGLFLWGRRVSCTSTGACVFGLLAVGSHFDGLD